MTDHPADQADSRSRRSAFAKIGAVAAGAWVAPQVLSTQAASAQSAPPCACPVAYADVSSTGLQLVLPFNPVFFNSDSVAPVGITYTSGSAASFTLASAGTYRVTYTLTNGSGDAKFEVALDAVPVSNSGVYLNTNQTLTRAVLVNASAGAQLSIQNTGFGIATLQSPDPAVPAASILIELIA